MPQKLPPRPLEDKENPMWCPDIQENENHPNHSKFAVSFEQRLRKGLQDTTNKPKDLSLKNSAVNRKQTTRPKSPVPKLLGPALSKPQRPEVNLASVPWRPSYPPDKTRKRKDCPIDIAQEEHESGFDDLLTSPKRFKSPGSYSSTSFILYDRDRNGALKILVEPFESSQSGPYEPDPAGSLPTIETSLNIDADQRIRDLEDALYGPDLGAETPKYLSQLVRRVHELAPGLRIRSRFSQLHPKSHQEILDFVAQQGFINFAILDLFRAASIKRISLTESFSGIDGLNEAGRQALRAFSLPNSFQLVTHLDFTSAALSQSNIATLALLPSLTVLNLSSTNITDRAVFQLTAFRGPLQRLQLANNSQISDDCIPAFLFLSRLNSLDLSATSVSMSGLRRLAKSFVKARRPLRACIPAPCKDYMNSLESQYWIDIEGAFPVVSKSSQVHGLSLASIKTNLKKHAMHNKSISLKGSEATLRSRLEDLLATREADLLVTLLVG